MNNMDDSMGPDEQSHGGISRRDMIKASVAAGALVWSAPVLLSGTASANHTIPCGPCEPAGTIVRLNISSMQISSANCGSTQCLTNRQASLGAACGTREDLLADCITAAAADLMEFVTPTQFNAGLATLDLSPLLEIRSVSINQQGGPGIGGCFFTDCGNLSTAQNSGPQNTTITGGTTIPPGTEVNTGFPNRIWVTNDSSFPGGQRIHVDTVADGNQDNLNEIGLVLCVSNAVTGQCP